MEAYARQGSSEHREGFPDKVTCDLGLSEQAGISQHSKDCMGVGREFLKQT